MKGRRTSNSKHSFSVYIKVENEYNNFATEEKSVSFMSFHVLYKSHIERLADCCLGFFFVFVQCIEDFFSSSVGA